MRAILILSLLIAIAGSTLFTAGALASTGAGAVRLTVHDDAVTPFAKPVLRLIALPDGASGATVTVVSRNSGTAAEAPLQTKTLAPMILRGLRVQPVLISPAGAPDAPGATAPADGALPFASKAAAEANSVTLEVSFRFDGSTSALSPETSATRTLFPAPYSSSGGEGCANALRHGKGYFEAAGLVNPDGADALAQQEGSYLIITAPEFLSAVEPLAAWKREKGFSVSVVTTDVTGTSNEQIRNYVGVQYHTAAIPPEYLLLVGDVEQLPTFGLSGNATDLPFVLQDGNDFLPDLSVGRISVQNLEKAQLVVTKILKYERDPFRGDGGAWMGRAIGVARDSNADTPTSVVAYVLDRFLEAGFTKVDPLLWPKVQPRDPPGRPVVTASFSEGASLVVYRGWAAAENGWNGQFLSEDARQTTNGWKLPVVFSFVCENNKFDLSECFGEALLRAGTLEDPKGGAGFVGNSERWSHTRYNDAMAIGTSTAIQSGSVRRLGDILLAGKSYLLQQYPLEIQYGSDTEESVEFYFYIYGILGDPEMSVWVGKPEAITVTHPATLAPGANFVEVAVADSASQAPVVGARVGVSQGDALLGCAWTDSRGVATVPLASMSATGAVKITVTDKNVLPYRGTASVDAAQQFLSLGAFQIKDDGSGQSLGNGNGIANPGERVDLLVALHNGTSAPMGGGQATLSLLGESVASVTITDGTATFENVPANQQVVASDPFSLTVAATVEDGMQVVLSVAAVSGGVTSTSDLRFTVAAPALRSTQTRIGGNGVLKQGELGDVTVSIINEGSIAASNVSAVIRAVTPDLAVAVDSSAAFGSLAVGATADNATPFRIQATAAATDGQAAIFKLVLTSSEGAINETSFSVPVGVVDVTAPLGSDKHGYWAYDNADTDYPETAPLYSWIECSPNYGGTGTRVNLADNRTIVVNLPFPFVFYGKTYNKARISDNGWIALDTSVDYLDFYNWSLPSPYGCGARIAPFWDNLDPAKAVNNVRVGDGIYTFYDEANHQFVVEWSRLGNTDQPGTDRPLLFKDLQTFELILLDPVYHPSDGSSDGVIQFQYKQILNIDTGRTYSTVGIENEAKDDALQCTYSNVYAPTAAPLSAGLAIRITTQAPRYRPFSLTEFRAAPDPGGVLLSWQPVDARPRGGYRVYRAEVGAEAGLAAEGEYKPVTLVSLNADTRSFLDAGADPAKTYSYRIGSTDPVGRETVLGPFGYAGGDAADGDGHQASFTLALRSPYHGGGSVSYAVPQRGTALLRIYDVTGRSVRTLVDGVVDPGSRIASWDGRDDAGRAVPGGIYFARLEAGGRETSGKLVMVR